MLLWIYKTASYLCPFIICVFTLKELGGEVKSNELIFPYVLGTHVNLPCFHGSRWRWLEALCTLFISKITLNCGKLGYRELSISAIILLLVVELVCRELVYGDFAWVLAPDCMLAVSEGRCKAQKKRSGQWVLVYVHVPPVSGSYPTNMACSWMSSPGGTLPATAWISEQDANIRDWVRSELCWTVHVHFTVNFKCLAKVIFRN